MAQRCLRGQWSLGRAFPPGSFRPLRGLELFLAGTAFPELTPFLDLLASGFYSPAREAFGRLLRLLPPVPPSTRAVLPEPDAWLLLSTLRARAQAQARPRRTPAPGKANPSRRGGAVFPPNGLVYLTIPQTTLGKCHVNPGLPRLGRTPRGRHPPREIFREHGAGRSALWAGGRRPCR